MSEFLQLSTNRSDLVVFDAAMNIIPSCQINSAADQEQNSKYPAIYNL